MNFPLVFALLWGIPFFDLPSQSKKVERMIHNADSACSNDRHLAHHIQQFPEDKILMAYQKILSKKHKRADWFCAAAVLGMKGGEQSKRELIFLLDDDSSVRTKKGAIVGIMWLYKSDVSNGLQAKDKIYVSARLEELALHTETDVELDKHKNIVYALEAVRCLSFMEERNALERILLHSDSPLIRREAAEFLGGTH